MRVKVVVGASCSGLNSLELVLSLGPCEPYVGGLTCRPEQDQTSRRCCTHDVLVSRHARQPASDHRRSTLDRQAEHGQYAIDVRDE